MGIETSNNVLTVQLRYCFTDETLHSMNAEVFNECERQFIKALKNAEKYLEDFIEVKVEPREKGSLIDILTILINKPEFTVTFTTLITIYATKFFEAKLASTKQKAEEVNKKLDNLQKIKEQIKAGTLNEDDFDFIASNDKDLRKQKSNFFKSAKKQSDITKVEVKAISNKNLQPIIVIVERNNFDDFIIPETTEKEEDVEKAKIYIVSPILVKGKKNSVWRGIFDDESIDFKITDKEFLQQVYGGLIKFSNGTFINCDLNVIKTTNIETDETKITREVTFVNNLGEDDKPIMKIIRSRRRIKADTNHHPTLFDNLEF